MRCALTGAAASGRSYCTWTAPGVSSTAGHISPAIPTVAIPHQTSTPATNGSAGQRSLLDERLESLLDGYDDATRSLVNTGVNLVVEEAIGGSCGSVSLRLSGGSVLAVFPDSSAGENWRFLGHQVQEHFVIFQGSVE